MISGIETGGSGRALGLDDGLSRLPGVGPKTAAALAEAGYATVRDLLLHLPRRWEDRTRLVPLDGPLDEGVWILARGRVHGLRVRRIRARRMTLVDGVIDDGRGELPVRWFNQPWIARRLANDREHYFFGQLRRAAGRRLELLNPEIEEAEEDAEGIVPVYPRIGRLGGRRLRRSIAHCLPALEGSLVDPLPEALRRRFDLPELATALRQLHSPSADREAEGGGDVLEELNGGASPGHARLAFDELLSFACAVAVRRRRRLDARAPRIDTRVCRRVVEETVLPFELTAAQRRALDEVATDLARPAPMGRLLQGDVGCGKTVVAALALRMALEAGWQAVLMAPTEVLAEQHARTLERYLGPAGWAPRLLTASQPEPLRREVLAGLADGTVPLVVGTHALFQEGVRYRQLGLAVIDEQHRFGVDQRSALASKGRSPHVLVMTATPIPRSLALTVYGDLDLSVIDELPPGRRPVRTLVRPASARRRLFAFVADEVARGGRAYVVYPVIDPTEASHAAALAEHEAGVRRLCPGVAVGAVHGRMAREQREEVLARFRDGDLQVLLATTVIEVGVDVPEATVMVVESADRFGLSQLHQLRGRVGRGGRDAWCVLVTGPEVSEAARRRLEVMCRSHDGFEIAEADLEIRGPGELAGVRQSGPTGFRFAHLVRHRNLVAVTRCVARELAERGGLEAMRSALAAFHPAARVAAPP